MPLFYGGYDLRRGFGKIRVMKAHKKVLSFSGTVCGVAVFLAICFMTGAACAASEASSASTFIYVDTSESPFWRTATNSTVELSIDYPAGVSSASLSVTGAFGYSMSDANVAAGLYKLSLPAATSPETEDVYDLVLTLGDGTVRTARFGVISGVSNSPEGSTRCIPYSGSPSWSRVHQRAVLPIPYGTTSFSIGGATVDTGLDGATGWYPFGPLAIDSSETVRLVTSEIDCSALLRSVGPGWILIVQ